MTQHVEQPGTQLYSANVGFKDIPVGVSNCSSGGGGGGGGSDISRNSSDTH